MGMKRFRNNQSGRSMIEILGVLAIIGILSVVGISGYSKAMNQIDTQNLLQDISLSVQRIQMLYAGQNSYKGINKNIGNLELLVNTKRSLGGDKKYMHRLNGEVILKSIARGKGFALIYNGLNRATCAKIASIDWGNEGNGLRYLVVSPTGILPPRGFPSNLDEGEYKAEDLPLSISDTVKYCECDPFYKCGVGFFYE